MSQRRRRAASVIIAPVENIVAVLPARRFNVDRGAPKGTNVLIFQHSHLCLKLRDYNSRDSRLIF